MHSNHIKQTLKFNKLVYKINTTLKILQNFNKTVAFKYGFLKRLLFIWNKLFQYLGIVTYKRSNYNSDFKSG